MNKQDAPARIEANPSGPRTQAANLFPFEKNRRAVDRVRRKMEIVPPTKQRSALLEFARAIGSRSRALTSAATGASTASAAISKVPEGFQLYYVGTERSWTAARAALKFAKVTQDGDGEGFLKIDRLPTEAEGHIIRDQLDIPKKRQSSEEEIARLRAADPIISPFRRQKPHFLAVRVGR